MQIFYAILNLVMWPASCLFHSRSPRSKNVIGIAQKVTFDLIYAAVKQQKKMKKILTIKLIYHQIL